MEVTCTHGATAMSGTPPTPPKLIVLMAFDRDEEGNLQPAVEPREMRDEGTARRAALELRDRHAGVLAWLRSADLALGEFGEPEVLALYGDVPEME